MIQKEYLCLYTYELAMYTSIATLERTLGGLKKKEL